MRTQCHSKPLELEGHCSGRRHLVAKKLIIEISGVNVFILNPSSTKERAIGGILPPCWPKITCKLLILGRRS